MTETNTIASQFQRDVLKFLKLVAGNGGANFTCIQLIILGEIWVAYDEGRAVCAKQVRELCGLPKATASRILNNLETDLRLITSKRDSQDARRKLLLPSPQLHELNDRMTDEYRKYWRATHS